MPEVRGRAETQEFDLDVGVIYTYEDAWIGPLLETLAASAPGLRVRLVLVDNASDRGVDPWLGCFRNTLVLRQERRRGYAENLNCILDASTARYALLLNTDMLFDPREQTLTKMVGFMDGRPQCGLSTCRIYHYDGSYGHPARRYPTIATVIGRRLARNRMLRRCVDDHLYAERDPRSTFACDWITGCFMMARAEAVRRVGGLDCGFRKYFEDIDWCARMNRAGFEVLHFGETYCFHELQRASKRVFSIDGREHLRSYARWLWKWRGGARTHSAASARGAVAPPPHGPHRLPVRAPNGGHDWPCEPTRRERMAVAG